MILDALLRDMELKRVTSGLFVHKSQGYKDYKDILNPQNYSTEFLIICYTHKFMCVRCNFWENHIINL